MIEYYETNKMITLEIRNGSVTLAVKHNMSKKEFGKKISKELDE